MTLSDTVKYFFYDIWQNFFLMEINLFGYRFNFGIIFIFGFIVSIVGFVLRSLSD